MDKLDNRLLTNFGRGNAHIKILSRVPHVFLCNYFPELLPRHKQLRSKPVRFPLGTHLCIVALVNSTGSSHNSNRLVLVNHAKMQK